MHVPRAVAAAMAVASSLGLPADGAVVLHRSNRLTLRLTPGPTVARVADEGEAAAQLVELERARLLAEAGCPVGSAEPRVAPAVHVRDGFAVTLWAFHEPAATWVAPEAYAAALRRLHAGLRTVEMTVPRWTDRVTEAQRIADDPRLSPELTGADRELLGSTLRGLRHAIEGRRASEQLLHGEPHPGNLLATRSGPLFVDLETLCRGPVELDLAHAPGPVGEHDPGVDQGLLDDCRGLVLALVAAWRWQRGDAFPGGREWGGRLLRALAAGPPWPTLEVVGPRRAAT